jgi:hypothetical protein
LIYALAAEQAAPREVRREVKDLDGLLGRMGHWFRDHF